MRRLCGILTLFLCLNVTSQAQEPERALEYYGHVQALTEAMDQGEWQAAVEAADKALAISQVDGDVWFWYGRALSRLQRHERAIDAFSRVHELGAFTNKMRAVVSFELASSNAHLGRLDQALRWLKDSYEAGYRDIAVFRNSQFAGLKGDPEYDAMVARTDVADLSRNEGLAYDLWFLDRELRRIHYAPYRAVSKETLDSELAKIRLAIPNLTDDEFYIRCRQYVALVGDGHTALRMNDWKAPDQRTTPLHMVKFTDGVFVVGATEEFKDLIGKRLLSINGTSVEEAWKLTATLVSKDNTYDDVAQVPTIFTFASALKGLGIARGDSVPHVFGGADGSSTRIDLPLGESHSLVRPYMTGDGLPLYLQRPNDPYWYTYLDQERTVYLQYNAVRQGSEPMEAFMARLFEECQGKPIDKFVIDVRFNGGGNSFFNERIQKPVLQNPKINAHGTLFVITGRNTFSAAQNFATDLMRSSEAIFVGEPTGSRPNFVGETIPVVLPYTRMRMTVSDLYWQRSWPMDDRQWIPPDIPTEMSSAMFFAKRDPAMEAIRAFKKD